MAAYFEGFNALKIIYELLPPFLRRTKIINWLKVQLYGLSVLNGDFLANRDVVLQEIKVNTLTIVLETFLNSTSSPLANNLKPIYIINKDKPRLLRCYKLNEGQSLPINYSLADLGDDRLVPPLPELAITYNIHEPGLSSFDFEVSVPNTFTGNSGALTLLQALINKYKTAGKTYYITIR